MNTVLHIDFLGEQSHLGYARLHVDLPFAPTPDIQFEQGVWHEGHKPTAVSYSVEDKQFYVAFPAVKIKDNDLEQYRSMYKSHGWEVS